MTEVQPVVCIEHKPQAIMVELLCRDLMQPDEISRAEESVVTVLMENEGANLIMDFQNVRMLSSSAFGFLLKLNKYITQRRGRLILCNLEKKVTNSPSDSYVYEIFKVVKLDRVFTICPDIPAALKLLDESK
ncbi:MAG: STAS domain-containing protein [Sedimentisphaerales bacterium]|nr:STAS domain-containing protein [Sedimentisphaerales bacterium]